MRSLLALLARPLDQSGELTLPSVPPAETSLAQAPLVGLLLRAKIQSIRDDIELLTQALDTDQDPRRLGELQELIGVRPVQLLSSSLCAPLLTQHGVQDLLSQVTAIRDAATESEVVVRDITRDIQSLDQAKRNLVASMNALKRFQMLGASCPARSRRARPADASTRPLAVNAFDQLTRLAKSRRYRETAQALAAVKELSAYFKTFSSVERVSAVSRGVVEVQNVLKEQVMHEFEEACVLLPLSLTASIACADGTLSLAGSRARRRERARTRSSPKLASSCTLSATTPSASYPLRRLSCPLERR